MSLSAFYEAMAAKARRDEAKDEARQTAERPKSREERERERAQSRQDIIDGRRMFLEQQAKQAAEADPEAAYLAHCKAQALKIVNAARAARNQPLLKSLDGEGDPTQGDDTSDEPKDKSKSKKKVVKKRADDDEDNEDAGEKDEGDDDFDSDKKERRGAANPAPGETEAEYWRRVDRTAAGIVAAGAKRRRGY